MSSGVLARRRSGAMVVRRRRRLAGALALAAVAGAMAVALPTLEHAAREFALPLSDASVIREQAVQKHLDPALIAAVIYAETRFDPRPSAAGAQGLMQLMPSTAHFLAGLSGGSAFTISDLATPAVNIAYGSYYLRYLLDHYRGDELAAVAAYNAGLANVDEWVSSARVRGHALSLGDIRFPQTKAYVQRVMDAQQAYRTTYAGQLGLTR